MTVGAVLAASYLSESSVTVSAVLAVSYLSESSVTVSAVLLHRLTMVAVGANHFLHHVPLHGMVLLVVVTKPAGVHLVTARCLARQVRSDGVRQCQCQKVSECQCKRGCHSSWPGQNGVTERRCYRYRRQQLYRL